MLVVNATVLPLYSRIQPSVPMGQGAGGGGGGVKGRSGQMWKIENFLPLPTFESQGIQTVASRSTVYAIPALSVKTEAVHLSETLITSMKLQGLVITETTTTKSPLLWKHPPSLLFLISYGRLVVVVVVVVVIIIMDYVQQFIAAY